MRKDKDRLQALLMSVILIASAIMPVKIVGAVPEKMVQQTLKILELQPGGTSVLKGQESVLESYFFGADNVEAEVQVDHMPITLFNADRTPLNGKYDVIYIGRGTGDNYEGYLKYYDNEQGVALEDKAIYRERYGALDADKTMMQSNIFYDGNEEGVPNGGLYESLEPIDITNLKKQELIEQAQKGQLIVVDELLMQDNTTPSTKLPSDMTDEEAVQGTRIQALAHAIKNEANVVTVQDAKDNMSVFQYVGKEYYQKKMSLKRPYIQVTESEAQIAIDSEVRELSFNVRAHNYNQSDPQKAAFNINVYVDSNGNGQFEDDEKLTQNSKLNQTNTNGEKGIGINISIPRQYGGYFYYMIEVETVQGEKTGLSNYITGTEQYTAEEIIPINILQITPNLNGNEEAAPYSGLDLSDGYIKEMYTAGSKKSEEHDAQGLDNYQFNVTTMTVNEIEAIYAADNAFKGYSQEGVFLYDLLSDKEEEVIKAIASRNPAEEDYIAPNAPGYEEAVLNEMLSALIPNDGKYSHLNGKYDMIILGFKDNYEHISNNAFILDLMAFIQTGQSVMFTHDSIGLAKNTEWGKRSHDQFTYTTVDSEGNIIKKKFTGEEEDKGQEVGREFTLAMRELVGQGSYNPDSTVDRYDYVNGLVQGRRVGAGSVSNKVTKIDTAQITSYPYTITPNKGEDKIIVSTTHHQWYNLDLEDPEINVWYVLDDGKYNWYDPMQSYYTYSKGNITYSGTGHSGVEDAYKETEQKMFVNTMVKATNTANHAPMISILDLTENQMVGYERNKAFKIKLEDQDLKDDLLDYEVYIYSGEVPENKPAGWLPTNHRLIVGEGKENTGKSVPRNEVLTVNMSAVDMQAILAKKDDQIINGQEFTIMVKATDKSGAESFETLTIKAMKPSVTIDFEGENGYLYGDAAETTVTIKVPDIANLECFNVKVYYEEVKPQKGVETTGEQVKEIEKKDFGDSTTYTFSTEQLLEGLTYNGLRAEVTYEFDDVPYDDTIIYPIITGEGKLTIEVVGEYEEALKDMTVRVTQKDTSGVSTQYEATTDISGYVIFDLLPSGDYTIELLDKEGYVLASGIQALINTTLQYSAGYTEAYRQAYQYKLNSKPIIEIAYTPKTSTFNAIEIYARLDGTGSEIKEAWIAYNGGENPGSSNQEGAYSDEAGNYLVSKLEQDGEKLKCQDTLPKHLIWDEPTPEIKEPFISWIAHYINKNGWYTIYTIDEKDQEKIEEIYITNIKTLENIT